MADVAEPLASVHQQHFLLVDHEYVDEHAGETLVTEPLEDHQLEDPACDFYR